MLVYGDVSRRERAPAKLARIAGALERAAARAPGLARHGDLVEALLEAGELAQAIADREFRSAGDVDAAAPPTDAAIELTMALARRVAASWTSRFATTGAALADEIARCAALSPQDPLDVKQPEGYAFYALYPESYLVAARGLAPRRWQVIGVRSIGTSLACMVAAGLGTGAPLTVRPVGDPFARRVAADPARIDRDAEAYAIVDEGPGLSGSSLASVARWLMASGVAEGAIHVFASHRNGPGPHAAGDARSFWQRAGDDGRIHTVSFDELSLEAATPAHRLDCWVRSVVGPLAAPLQEIGGGVWRSLRERDRALPLPPAHPWQERRKFLAVADDGSRWLVKFNGLGRRGDAKLERARSLAAGGFVPRPVATCHGFVIERWCEGREPGLPLALALRPAMVDRLASYLVQRLRFAAPVEAGASLASLAAMARQNTEEALGPPVACA
ncbi:MAG: hypothetical protein JO090_15430, partial [Rhizobacter sp.]|nr:hypothetical protein [Rhizobacter sp.]